MKSGEAKDSPNLLKWGWLVVGLAFIAQYATAEPAAGTQAAGFTNTQPSARSAAAGSVNVLHAAFRADGRALVTFGGDGKARVWNVASGAAVSPGTIYIRNWTIQLGAARYGFAHIGPAGAWPNGTFLIWKSAPHFIPLWVMILVAALVLILLALGKELWAGRNKHPETAES
jgi:hypothetical protein